MALESKLLSETTPAILNQNRLLEQLDNYLDIYGPASLDPESLLTIKREIASFKKLDDAFKDEFMSVYYRYGPTFILQILERHQKNLHSPQEEAKGFPPPQSFASALDKYSLDPNNKKFIADLYELHTKKPRLIRSLCATQGEDAERRAAIRQRLDATEIRTGISGHCVGLTVWAITSMELSYNEALYFNADTADVTDQASYDRFRADRNRILNWDPETQDLPAPMQKLCEHFLNIIRTSQGAETVFSDIALSQDISMLEVAAPDRSIYIPTVQYVMPFVAKTTAALSAFFDPIIKNAPPNTSLYISFYRAEEAKGGLTFVGHRIGIYLLDPTSPLFSEHGNTHLFYDSESNHDNERIPEDKLATRVLSAATSLHKECKQLAGCIRVAKLVPKSVGYLPFHLNDPERMFWQSKYEGENFWKQLYEKTPLDHSELNSLLIVAAMSSNTAALEYCLKNNANPNTRNNDGSTALYWATVSGSIENVQLLLQHNAEINIRSGYNDETALMVAIRKNPAIALLFLKEQYYKFDLKAVDKNRDTALHYVVREILVGKPELATPQTLENLYEVLQLLLEHGNSTAIANRQGKTPLMLLQEAPSPPAKLQAMFQEKQETKKPAISMVLEEDTGITFLDSRPSSQRPTPSSTPFGTPDTRVRALKPGETFTLDLAPLGSPEDDAFADFALPPPATATESKGTPPAHSPQQAPARSLQFLNPPPNPTSAPKPKRRWKKRKDKTPKIARFNKRQF